MLESALPSNAGVLFVCRSVLSLGFVNDVDPQLYLTQVLMNLPAARMNKLSVWLPDQWKQLHAARIAN
jgi:hypothetical protein